MKKILYNNSPIKLSQRKLIRISLASSHISSTLQIQGKICFYRSIDLSEGAADSANSTTVRSG